MSDERMISVKPLVLEKALRDAGLVRFATDSHVVELRALLDAESAPCAKSQVEGKRERFQKWVMATKHPVFGFLDGRSLARGDDRTGYADEYVQGLWVAYLEFGAEQPAPVSVPRLEMAHVVRSHMEIPGCPVLTSNQCHALAMKLNACLDEITRLNAKS